MKRVCEVCGEEISQQRFLFSFDIADYHSFCYDHFSEYLDFRNSLVEHIVYNQETKQFEFNAGVVNDN